MTVKKNIPCSFYDIPSLESWLDEMALQGLFLKNFSRQFDWAVFEVGDPARGGGSGKFPRRAWGPPRARRPPSGTGPTASSATAGASANVVLLVEYQGNQELVQSLPQFARILERL